MTPREDSQDIRISRQLEKLLNAIEVNGRAILPQSNDDLLKSIVEAAARIFSSAAASILLVNEQEKLLEFKVAYGASNRDLVGSKFPLDKGIAGYVVMTGQPLAISNVRQDARFNQDFAKSTGYVPNSILAMPLRSGIASWASWKCWIKSTRLPLESRIWNYWAYSPTKQPLPSTSPSAWIRSRMHSYWV